MSREKELFFCTWYKPQYGETTNFTNFIIVKAISPEAAKAFCKDMLRDEGEDWTKYIIYCTLYNENNTMMKNIFEEQEFIAWEAN